MKDCKVLYGVGHGWRFFSVMPTRVKEDNWGVAMEFSVLGWVFGTSKSHSDFRVWDSSYVYKLNHADIFL